MPNFPCAVPVIAFVLLVTFTALVWTCKYIGTNKKSPSFPKCMSSVENESIDVSTGRRTTKEESPEENDAGISEVGG